MIESLIAAEKECAERVDIRPDKALLPIGHIYKEWIECEASTELPHWGWWEVVGHIQSFRGRSGNKLLYERVEEIRGCDEPA